MIGAVDYMFGDASAWFGECVYSTNHLGSNPNIAKYTDPNYEVPSLSTDLGLSQRVLEKSMMIMDGMLLTRAR